MEARIEIMEVTGNEAGLKVGCEFKKRAHAEQVFKQIENEYQEAPNYGVGDFLVDLWVGHDLIDTVITNEAGAKQIDERFFREG